MDGDCACGAAACGAGGSFGSDCGSGEGFGGGGAVQVGCLRFLGAAAFAACAAFAALAGSGPAGVSFRGRVSARRPTYFPLFRQRKVGKAKRPGCPRPSASLRATCVVAVAGFAVKLSSRCALRSNITASQMTKQSCPSAGLQPRNHHAAGADIREFARAFASLGPWFETERSDGVGCWLPQPPLCPRLRWAGCGVAALPKDRAASSSDLPQLFERRAKRKASSAAHPHPAQRRSPAAKRRVVGSSGASLPRFLVARQESGSAPGRNPAPKTTTRQGQKQTQSQTQTAGTSRISEAHPSLSNCPTNPNSQSR